MLDSKLLISESEVAILNTLLDKIEKTKKTKYRDYQIW